MFSLIITIIAIALVAAIALVSLYYSTGPTWLELIKQATAQKDYLNKLGFLSNKYTAA